MKEEKKLLEFNNQLEEVIKNDVCFKVKMAEEKKLHATIKNYSSKIDEPFRIEQYMLRLTAIRDKKIWFSYDFVTNQMLNREESLDKTKWYKTIHEFTQQTKLLPTRQGYMKIE